MSALLIGALGISVTACGSQHEVDGNGGKDRCEPSSGDLLAEALGYERAVVTRGRADAAFDQEFSEESESLLDQADEQQTELIEEVAAELGLELPVPGAVAECSSKGGVAREPLSSSVQFAFAVTALTLVEAAKNAPIAGAMEGRPYMSTTTGTAADGSTRTTVMTFNTMTSGHDSVVTVTTTMNSDVTTGTGSTSESAYVAGAIDVCPDSGGLSRGNITIVLDGATANGGTYHAESNQNFTFVVNDQATVASTEVESSFEYRATGGAREGDVEGHGQASFAGESNHLTGGNVVIDHSDGSAESEALVNGNLMTYGLGTATLIRGEAQKKWRGGTCIEVVPDPMSAMVDKDTQLEITATPRHKIDMSNVDATVVATLSGVKSLDKQGQRVSAPATYSYVAGSQFKDQGVVNFKSTSKRGIGQGTSTITVRCDEEMECPDGKMLNVETCMCECTEVMECSDGQVWDEEECRCVCEPEECVSGERWDDDLCECVCDRECPTGQALNQATCMCEETCEIDPMFGNISPEVCKWVGTINVTMSESGSEDLSNVEFERTVTWDTSYDASLTVEDPEGGTGMFFLDGSISGNWERVDASTFPAPNSCTLIDKQIATVSAETNRDNAFGGIVPNGDGTFGLMVGLSPDLELSGMQTVMGCDADDTSEFFGISIGGYMGKGTPSRDAFTGSTDFESLSFEFVAGKYATFRVSWNLHLVRR